MSNIDRGHASRIAVESRLLYSLLDASESLGVMRDGQIRQCWEEIKFALDQVNFEAESEKLYRLMAALGSSGAIAGTWVEARWLALDRRVLNPGEMRESRVPW